jgi:hypothetical protein
MARNLTLNCPPERLLSTQDWGFVTRGTYAGSLRGLDHVQNCNSAELYESFCVMLARRVPS